MCWDCCWSDSVPTPEERWKAIYKEERERFHFMNKPSIKRAAIKFPKVFMVALAVVVLVQALVTVFFWKTMLPYQIGACFAMNIVGDALCVCFLWRYCLVMKKYYGKIF